MTKELHGDAEVDVGEFEQVARPGCVLLRKYKVERVLGRGGMGVVLAARHIELGELFAIKVLDPDSAAAPNAASRFLLEARAAARLTGLHVARVYDVGHLEGGTPYLVMEHLAGENLSQFVERRGALPFVEAAELVLAACEALAEAHSLGITHRDIKLANLFLTERGGRPCLKVIDFGVSKYGEVQVPLTMPGSLVGSPHSMSPEQIHDSHAVDGRTDIWSLGVVLYQLTTGAAPFHGDNLPKLIRSVLRDTPTPPSRLRPELPVALDDVVAHCLAKLPEDRYADVAELASALRALSTLPIGEGARAIGGELRDAKEGLGEAAGPVPRVFVSCRGDDERDLKIGASFKAALSDVGVSAFLASKSVVRGKNWTTEVTEALSGCDAFLLVLSPEAAVSEMVAGEVERALQLVAGGSGLPLIVPVRVRLSDADTGIQPLAERLQEFEYEVWSSETDTAGIVERLLQRLRREAVSGPASGSDVASVGGAAGVAGAAGVGGAASVAGATTQTSVAPSGFGAPESARFFVERPGGIVSTKSPFYVVRGAVEEACLREVTKPGALIRVKGPRQMGKTSLMTGIAERAAETGARTVVINMQMADAAMLGHQERLLRWLCAVVTRRLKLPLRAIEEQWDDIFGAKDNCTAYFEECLLVDEAPLVLVLDQVDKVFEAPSTAEDFWVCCGRGMKWARFSHCGKSCVWFWGIRPRCICHCT